MSNLSFRPYLEVTMKKHYSCFLILAVLFVCLNPADARTLKIGSMSPLTGPYELDGNDIKNGVLCAIDTINDQGGIKGYDKIELFPQDTACDPKQAVAAANKLINLEVAGVIGAYCSSSTIPASETLDEEDIIMITPASTNGKVTDRGLEYMFRMCGNDDDQAPTAVKFIAKVLGAKTIFIVNDKTTSSQNLADGVEQGAKNLGLSILGRDHVNIGDKDFSSIISMARVNNADVLYMSLSDPYSGGLLAIQAKRMGLKSKIVSSDAMYHPNLVKMVNDYKEGFFVVSSQVSKNRREVKEVVKKCGDQYGELGIYGFYAYDATMVLLKAIKNGGSTDPSKIRSEIMKLDYEGVTKRIKFKVNGDSISNWVVFELVDGVLKSFVCGSFECLCDGACVDCPCD